MSPIYFARVIKSNNPSFRVNEFIGREWKENDMFGAGYHYFSVPLEDAIIFLDEIKLTTGTFSLISQLKDISANCPNIEFELMKYEMSK